GLLEEGRHHAVYAAVDRFDAADMGFHHLHRGQFAGRDATGNLDCTQAGDFTDGAEGESHDPPLREERPFEPAALWERPVPTGGVILAGEWATGPLPGATCSSSTHPRPWRWRPSCPKPGTCRLPRTPAHRCVACVPPGPRPSPRSSCPTVR